MLKITHMRAKPGQLFSYLTENNSYQAPFTYLSNVYLAKYYWTAKFAMQI